MRLPVVVVLALGLIPALARPAGAFTMAAFDATVIGVADGDTLTVLRDRAQILVRLHGIDAPERRQPFSARATQLTSEPAFGQVVRTEPTDRDRYGRVVAEVILPDGRSLNRQRVQAELAWWFRRDAPNYTDLAGLEAEARAARRGLWADPKPVLPWEWRRPAANPSSR